MAYNITLTTGEMNVLLPNGDTQAFNLGESTSVKVLTSKRPVHAAASPPAPNRMSVQFATQYYVRLRMSDCSEYRIEMGAVDNQATWLNSQAGANACVTAIQAALN